LQKMPRPLFMYLVVQLFSGILTGDPTHLVRPLAQSSTWPNFGTVDTQVGGGREIYIWKLACMSLLDGIHTTDKNRPRG
jgi:hypothetical protein